MAPEEVVTLILVKEPDGMEPCYLKTRPYYLDITIVI